jgi:predicted nuclease of predicted toxin-antitoxin system
MNFVCDVHIPLKLVTLLKNSGFTAIHVNQLPNKWNTSDTEICKFADQGNYIVITKDADFRNSFFVNKTPKKLINLLYS